jgi:hypothetical protein
MEEKIQEIAAKRDEIWERCLYLWNIDPHSCFHKVSELQALKKQGEVLNREIDKLEEQLCIFIQCVNDKIIF